jgi:T4 RnlA family RNA ligase
MQTQNFPVITSLELFKSQVGEKEEIRYMTSPHGFTTVSYMVSMPTTFDNPHARECRGIVFDVEGKVISRPLTKFFNMNERDGARPHDFNWAKLARCMAKRDGSMIHTVKTGPDSFDVKSKKSFTSDVANAARALISSSPGHQALCMHAIALDCTAIFEFTSPGARIVLPYLKDELVLLHVRENESGRYYSDNEIRLLGTQFGVSTVDDDVLDSFPELIKAIAEGDAAKVWAIVQQLAETVENIEGWIFQFDDGEMVKVKTKWYMERHRCMTFLRERDVQLMVLRESLDDIKAMLASDGVDISELEAIEAKVGKVLIDVLHELTAIYEADKNLERKDFALKHGPAGLKYPQFSLLMKLYEGKEPDVKGWYERQILPTVSLRTLVLVNSIGEAE